MPWAVYRISHPTGVQSVEPSVASVHVAPALAVLQGQVKGHSMLVDCFRLRTIHLHQAGLCSIE